MYSIHQFRPTFHLLIFLGITGFCLATRSPGMWILSSLVMAMHYFLLGNGRSRPMPGWAAFVIGGVLMLISFRKFFADAGSQLAGAGQCLVALQLVMMFQEGSGRHKVENRNYFGMLLLSLLLMVAAAISTASLYFGMLLVVYLVLGLYCSQLFHLKAESDAAKVAMALPKDVINPAVLRQDERLLPSSMRRLTALVSVVGLITAALVFVSFPRGPGAGLFGQLNFKPPQAMTGFSESVSFESVARIQQNNALVARVRLFEDGELVRGTRTLYMRGLTLDTYTGDGRSALMSAGREGGRGPGGGGGGGGRGRGGDDRVRPPWQWIRGSGRADVRTFPAGEVISRQSNTTDAEELAAEGVKALMQEITLEPTGVNVIFAAPGPYRIKFNRDVRMTFFPSDESIRLLDSPNLQVDYTVYSRGEVGFRPFVGSVTTASRAGDIPRNLSPINPRILEYAQLPEVSGVDSAGVPLWRRIVRGRPGEADATVAANIEKHLRSKFSYTLDLTDTTRDRDLDPLEQFLYDTKRGHCEYFAGGMTILCQALGMDARMVTGFRCEGDAYNNLTERYSILQSHAHAWVEVRVGPEESWATYDPTSGLDPRTRQNASLISRVKRLIDYLEFTWADTVVAYDRERRDNVWRGVENGMSNTAASAQRKVANWRDWLQTPDSWGLSPQLVGSIIIVMVSLGIIAVAYFMFERMRLRRRALRIGLAMLPGGDQLRLARQLGFYDDLLTLLEERGYVRPKHLTPHEFAHTLTHLPAEAYDTISRLTRVYYRIRYGRARLAPAYHRRLLASLADIIPALGPQKLQD